MGLLLITFLRNESFRVVLGVFLSDPDASFEVYEHLLQQKAEIDEVLGEPSEWDYIKNSGVFYVLLKQRWQITASEEELAKLQTWAVDAITHLLQVKDRYFSEAIQALAGEVAVQESSS